MRLTSLIRGAVLCLLSIGAPARAHTQQAPPPAIRRRLAQALWPEVLFDSTGHPSGRLHVRGGRGDPRTSLRLAPAAPVTGMPGVQVFVGDAFRCFDSRSDIAAVAVRGADTVTLREPADLQLVLPWLGDSLTAADSARIRHATMAWLDATCLLGGGVRPVSQRSDVRDTGGVFSLRAANGDSTWTLPPASVGPNGSYTEYQFGIRSGFGVYQLSVAWTPAAKYLVSSTPIALESFGP